MTDQRNDTERTDESPATFFKRVGSRLSRRGFLSNTAKVGGGALALSAAGSTAAAGGTENGSDGDSENGGGNGNEMDEVSTLDVLNFALTLEHLEATYYNQFLDEYSESEVERSEAARIFADDGLRFSTYQKIEEVRDHEEAHVEALTQTIEELGGDPVEPAEYEFPYETIEEFVDLSATIEAVGVSAYAGAAPLIDEDDDPILEAALSILSVEARHTSYFRVLNTSTPFPSAFDEPRTMEEVLEIASQFIVGMEGKEGVQTFTVTIENVSTPGLLSTDRAKGAVPLSPGAYGVYTGENPAFTEGTDANRGTKLIAEDGFPGGPLPPKDGGLAESLAEAENVSDSGVFASKGGSLKSPALGPGETAQFSFMASPGEMLTFETMFVQSDDWFYGLDLSLFDGDEPIDGEVTNELVLYDAGTEEDAPPGEGPKEPPGPVQKPVQPPMAIDVGTDEDVPIRKAEDRHPDFDIPDAEEVIEVTVSSQ